MDVDKTRMQRLEKHLEDLHHNLGSWKERPLDTKLAFSVAAAAGAYRILGGTESLKIDKGAQLAKTAIKALRDADFPAQYEKLAKNLSNSEDPLDSTQAVEFLNMRANAQFAYLAIRNQIFADDTEMTLRQAFFPIMRQIVEKEDDFFARYSWAFFSALEWIEQERTVLGLEAKFDFAWLWTISDAADESWNLPLPVASEPETDKELERRIDFHFITLAFGKAFDPPIDDATRAQVLARLAETLPAHQRLAAKAEAMLPAGSDMMENLVRQVGVFHIHPRKDLPGFFIRLRRDRSIELIFKDSDGQALSAFENANVQMGGMTVPVGEGSAILIYNDLVSLYDDMANLDERLVVVLSDGTRKTRFLPG